MAADVTMLERGGTEEGRKEMDASGEWVGEAGVALYTRRPAAQGKLLVAGSRPLGGRSCGSDRDGGPLDRRARLRVRFCSFLPQIQSEASGAGIPVVCEHGRCAEIPPRRGGTWCAPIGGMTAWPTSASCTAAFFLPSPAHLSFFVACRCL